MKIPSGYGYIIGVLLGFAITIPLAFAMQNPGMIGIAAAIAVMVGMPIEKIEGHLEPDSLRKNLKNLAAALVLAGIFAYVLILLF